MGKRSTFKRRKNDLYRTPGEAIPALAHHLPDRFRFAEPCAGNGLLSDHLQRVGGSAMFLGDQVPGRGDVTQQDALGWRVNDRPRRHVDYIITNPPWSRALLHPMICHFSAQRPTWLLFDADWMHTVQSARFNTMLRKVVSVGRLKWIPGSKSTGKDNCAWYLFDQNTNGATEFVGRQAA
jgi:hypothetical protein